MPRPSVQLDYDTAGAGLAPGERVVWTHEAPGPRQSGAAYWVAAGIVFVAALVLAVTGVNAALRGRARFALAALSSSGAVAFAAYWLTTRAVAVRTHRPGVTWTLTTRKLVRRAPGEPSPGVAALHQISTFSCVPATDGRDGTGTVRAGDGEMWGPSDIAGLTDPRGFWLLLLNTRAGALRRLRRGGRRPSTNSENAMMKTSLPATDALAASPPQPAPPEITAMLDAAAGEVLLWWARPIPDQPRVRRAVARAVIGFLISGGISAACAAAWWYARPPVVIAIAAVIAGLFAFGYAVSLRTAATLGRRVCGGNVYAITDRRLLWHGPAGMSRAASRSAKCVPLDTVGSVTAEREAGRATVDVNAGFHEGFEQVTTTDAEADRIVNLVLAARARWILSLGGPSPYPDEPHEGDGEV